MPTDWPDPPWLEHYLFEDPIPMGVMLAITAVVMFLAGGRAGRRRVQIGALAPLALAGLIVLASYLVVTDREAMLAQTRKLVYAATTPFDTFAVEQLVDPSFKMTLTNGATIVNGRDELIRQVGRAERMVTIDSITVTNHMERMDGPDEGRVYIAIFSEVSGEFGGPAKTRWVFTWRRSGDGWKLIEAAAREGPVSVTKWLRQAQ